MGKSYEENRGDNKEDKTREHFATRVFYISYSLEHMLAYFL